MLRHGASCVLRSKARPVHVSRLCQRTMATAPGADPLFLLKEEAMKRNQCDPSGYRLPDVHWAFSIAIQSDDLMMPPSLRTVSFQRVSEDGIDFCIKRGSKAAKAFATGRPMSILLQQGTYKFGETISQWRAEGHCETIPVEDLLHVIPDYTIAGMVASKRFEDPDSPPSDRTVVQSSAQVTSVVQSTIAEMENGTISEEEVDRSIKAFRFHPDRVERMTASPDQILWVRWQWERESSGDCPEGTLLWKEPVMLLPH